MARVSRGNVGTVVDVNFADLLVVELSPVVNLGVLIGIPVLVIVIVALAILGPHWSRAGRWRPGQPWRDEPLWLGGEDAPSSMPALPAEADTATGRVDMPMGGARGTW